MDQYQTKIWVAPLLMAIYIPHIHNQTKQNNNNQTHHFSDDVPLSFDPLPWKLINP